MNHIRSNVHRPVSAALVNTKDFSEKASFEIPTAAILTFAASKLIELRKYDCCHFPIVKVIGTISPRLLA